MKILNKLLIAMLTLTIALSFSLNFNEVYAAKKTPKVKTSAKKTNTKAKKASKAKASTKKTNTKAKKASKAKASTKKTNTKAKKASKAKASTKKTNTKAKKTSKAKASTKKTNTEAKKISSVKAIIKTPNTNTEKQNTVVKIENFKNFNNAPRMKIITNDKKFDDVRIEFTDYNGLDESRIEFYTANNGKKGKRITSKNFIKKIDKVYDNVDKTEIVKYIYTISNKYLKKKTNSFYLEITDRINSPCTFKTFFRIKKDGDKYSVDYAPRVYGWYNDGNKTISFIVKDYKGEKYVKLYDLNGKNPSKEIIHKKNLPNGETKVSFPLSKFTAQNGEYKIKIVTTDGKKTDSQKGSRVVMFTVNESKNTKKKDTKKKDTKKKDTKKKDTKKKDTKKKDTQKKEETKVYYVSKNGSNSNSGTSANKPLKTISKGIKKLSAGETLVILPGTYNEKISISKKASLAKPITIKGQGNVIVNGKNLKGALMKIKNTSHVKIEGITFKNLIADSSQGIYMGTGVSNVTVNNCNFENIKCKHPKAEDKGSNAIYIEGKSDVAINNISISNCKLTNIGAGYSEALSVEGNCTNINISNTVVTSNNGLKGNIGICICGNYNTCKNKKIDRPRNVTIKKCKVTNCKSPYGDTAYGIYVDGGENVKIIDNTVKSCQGGIEVGAEVKNPKLSGRETENITVQKNVINNCSFGVAIGGYEKNLGTAYNVTLDNNTIENCGGKKSEVLTLAKCNKVKIMNTRFKANNKATIIYNEMSSKYTKNVTFKNNNYYNGGSSKTEAFTWHNTSVNFLKWEKKTKDVKSYFMHK